MKIQHAVKKLFQNLTRRKNFNQKSDTSLFFNSKSDFITKKTIQKLIPDGKTCIKIKLL